MIQVIKKKLLKFEAEGQEFAKLRSLDQFILTVKCQYNFWYQDACLAFFWRFLRLDKLEELKFKMDFFGLRNMQEKLEKLL